VDTLKFFETSISYEGRPILRMRQYSGGEDEDPPRKRPRIEGSSTGLQPRAYSPVQQPQEPVNDFDEEIRNILTPLNDDEFMEPVVISSRNVCLRAERTGAVKL